MLQSSIKGEERCALLSGASFPSAVAFSVLFIVSLQPLFRPFWYDCGFVLSIGGTTARAWLLRVCVEYVL